MKKFNIKTSFKTFVIVSLLSSSVSNYADDTEVFFSVNVSKPNLLFVLDTSGSMAWDVDGTSATDSKYPGTTPGYQGQSRMTILQNSVTAVLAAAPANVNIGLMRYGPGANNLPNAAGNWEANFTTENVRTHMVSGVSFPLTDIKASANSVIATPADATNNFPNPNTVPTANVTVGDYVTSIVNSWTAGGGTPIVDALYEAALYYRGEKVHYGQSTPNSTVGAHPSTYSGNPITADITNGANARNNATAPNYISPITSSCQNNYIALLSDGAPTYYYQNDANANNISGQTNFQPPTPPGNSNVGKQRGPFAEIMQGNPGFSTLAQAITGCADAPSGFTSGKCAPELTSYLATNDNVPNATATNPNGLDDIQTIKTFTVGFGVAPNSTTEQFLQSLETIDDDPETTYVEKGYFPATDQAELVTAFTEIINSISKPSGTLASPGYSVNVKSGLEHEKDIYIPVFDRKDTSRWSGNLKKFTLVDVNGKRKIRGQNNLDAVDELGGFTAAAWDEWSTSSTADGLDVDKGGVASLLDNPQVGGNGRRLYSNLTGSADIKLTDPENWITKANFAALTDADLGIVPSTDDSSYRETLANFIRGYINGDETAGARKHMGDMLHSEPLVITYDQGNAGSEKLQYIFAGTNEGYLHAFDTATGKEQFAFMPKELLKNIDPQFLNAGTQKDHKYGIDGSLTSWKDPDTGKRYLYFGLRRGGYSYYALDITSIANPKLEWIISGDSNVSTPHYYPTMGQSWSAPYLANVGDSNGIKTPAIIFTGGYDEADDRDLRVFCANEDDICTFPDNTSGTVWYGADDTWVSKDNVTGSIACNNSTFGDPLVGTKKTCKVEINGGKYDSRLAITATKGNDVFIFDARDASPIWSLQESAIAEDGEIVNSIPGGVRILDTTYNGLIDRMYFADTGGFVWRLDLGENAGAGSKLYKFAQLGSKQKNVNSRKFYNEPDVSVMKLKGKTTFLVSIGSGFRAHPMDKRIEDKFFMLLDKIPFAPALKANGDNINPIFKGNLDQISISDTGVVSRPDTILGRKGLMVNLPADGEKVLATAVTVDGVVMFTTLVPETLADPKFPNINLCAAPATQGRLYAINVFTGGAGLDLNEDKKITDADISMLVAKGEIPGKPQQIVNALEVGNIVGDDGTPTGEKSCTHPVDIRIGKKLSQATGYDTCRLESVYWSDPALSQ